MISFNYREQIVAASSSGGGSSNPSIEGIIGGIADIVLDYAGASVAYNSMNKNKRGR